MQRVDTKKVYNKTPWLWQQLQCHVHPCCAVLCCVTCMHSLCGKADTLLEEHALFASTGYTLPVCHTCLQRRATCIVGRRHDGDHRARGSSCSCRHPSDRCRDLPHPSGRAMSNRISDATVCGRQQHWSCGCQHSVAVTAAATGALLMRAPRGLAGNGKYPDPSLTTPSSA